jgi:hypothetical protein
MSSGSSEVVGPFFTLFSATSQAREPSHPVLCSTIPYWFVVTTEIPAIELILSVCPDTAVGICLYELLKTEMEKSIMV